ncbi:hypothetical protein K8I85_02050, partial [bacterium]|nr:hypothetical protein [bacterium]
MKSIPLAMFLAAAVGAHAETEPVIQPAPETQAPVVTVELPFAPQPLLPVPLDANAPHLYPDAKGRPAVYIATEGPRGPLTEGELA